MAVIVVNSNGFACTLYSGGIASFNRSNKYFSLLRHLGRQCQKYPIEDFREHIDVETKNPSPLLDEI